MATKEQFAFGLRQKLNLITPSELAIMLEVTEHAVVDWRKNGTGPAYTRLGKRVFYRVEDVQDWIKSNVNREKPINDDAL